MADSFTFVFNFPPPLLSCYSVPPVQAARNPCACAKGAEPGFRLPPCGYFPPALPSTRSGAGTSSGRGRSMLPTHCEPRL